MPPTSQTSPTAQTPPAARTSPRSRTPPASPPARAAEPPLVIVGAGAAGLMAAIFAATTAAGPGGNGRRVVLLERTRDGGRKILVSGGGRCNILPSTAAPERFVTSSSLHTLRKILLSWPLAEQRHFFEEEAGVALALEAETGKLFPRSNQAREVRDRLLALAIQRGVELRRDATVVDLIPPGTTREPAASVSSTGKSALDARNTASTAAATSGWRVVLADGSTLAAGAVVLAAGGLSLPGTGSDGTGFAILRRLGIALHPTYPALTPLTAEPAPFAHLAGISLPLTLRAPTAQREHVVQGGFLFTHRGYSGPVVLDLSHLAVLSRQRPTAAADGTRVARDTPQKLLAQWTELDAATWDAELRRPAGTVMAPLRRRLPERLAEALLATAGVPAERPLSQLRRDERQRLITVLTRFPLPWSGDEGYRKAEVTGGGVALDEVLPRTLESRRQPGLFLCGELLDAFGPIGGHNFQWAWATGRAAGSAAGRSACATSSAPVEPTGTAAASASATPSTSEASARRPSP